MFDSGSPLPIMMDEDEMVNLTVGLTGNVCGEVEIYFRVSDNSSFAAIPGILYTMLESSHA